MPPIRILLVAMPRLMGDIVEAELLAQPDMALVGTRDSTAGLVEELRSAEPDFVLIGAEHTGMVERLFEERPRIRVLELEPVAADAHLYELRPRRVDLGQVSVSELVTAIRSAANGPRWVGEG